MKTEECIAVMQAYVDGKPIQYKIGYQCDGEWIDCDTVASWNWAHLQFRIKPREAREYVIALNRHGEVLGCSASIKAGSIMNLPPGCGVGAIKETISVREVLPEAPRRKPRECWTIFAEGKQQYLRMWGGKIEAEARSNCVESTDEVVHMREVIE